jgi:rod shape-determining protein MreC
VYTSGDDRIFPRGFRVGIVKVVRPAQPFKEILVEPSGMQRGLEDVLILIEGVHERIPEAPSGMQPIYMLAPPPGSDSKPADPAVSPSTAGTEADRLRGQYQTLGVEQKHTYGDNPPGAKPADFTRLPNPNAPAAGRNPSANPAANPPAGNPADPGAGKTTPPGTAPSVEPPASKPAAPAPGESPSSPKTVPAGPPPAKNAPEAPRRLNPPGGAPAQNPSRGQFR